MPCEHGTDSSEVCTACPPATVVTLAYFRRTGKWYGEGSYVSAKRSWHAIIDEVDEKLRAKTLPGLLEGHSSFIVLIEPTENLPFSIYGVRHLLL